MSLVLTNHADKAKSIDVIEVLMRQFLFPAVGPEGRANLTEHLAWLRRQPQDMKVDLKLETFPSQQATAITLVIGFEPNAPKAN